MIVAIACSTNSQYIGKVNKNNITRTDYLSEFGMRYSAFVQRYSVEPDSEQRKQIADSAFQRIVEGYFLQDLFKKYNITVSHREVLDTLRTNIPEYIKNDTRFQNLQGAFNRDTYLQALQTDRPIDLTELRNIYQTSIIPYRRLQNIIISQRNISEKDIRELYQIKYATAEVTIHTFTENDIDINEINITDKEIAEYYDKNKITFFKEPTADLNWVLFPLAPSQNDINKIAATADSLYRAIRNGAPFATLARDFSAQPYARQLGSDGYREIEEFEPEIQTKIRSTQTGQTIPPFIFQNAHWILQIDEKTTNMVKLNIIKIDIKPSNQTIETRRNQMERFVELQNIIGFARTADEMRMTLYSKKDLSLGNSYIETIGDISDIIYEIERLPEKTILSPILIPDIDIYVIFQIDKKTPSAYKTIYEVSDQITQTIRNEKMIEYIIQKANHALNQKSTQNTTNTNITYNSKNTYPYEFIRDVLTKTTGQTTKIHTDQQTAYFATIIENHTLERPPIDTQKTILRIELQNIDREKYFTQWINNQRTKIKIKDNRKNTDF